MNVLGLNLVVLSLHVRDGVCSVHRECELEVCLTVRERFDVAGELLRPDRALENLDEQLLLDERVAEVRAFLDVLRSLLRELLEAVLQWTPVESDVRPVLDTF